MTDSFFGEQYAVDVKKRFGKGLTKTDIFHRNGHSTAYLESGDRAAFGHHLQRQAAKDPAFVSTLAQDLKDETDAVRAAIARLHPTDAKAFQEFLPYFHAYVPPHVGVKNIVGYLNPKQLDAFLPELESARVHTEDVFTKTEAFTEAVAQRESKQAGRSPNHFLCLTEHEFQDYQKTRKLPKPVDLENRWHHAALVFENGHLQPFTGKNAERVENALHAHTDATQVKGAVAFPGFAQGVARIVLDPKKNQRF